ncbi:ABC transporter ATP-binding protein [Natronosalvus rutilus]|uniref:ABC transporter ATP-binding protein n=1 Tax=Natronosalvus rutilus TaxID=2953753 RepID=A0A9E7SVZ8_9EURY|nr:ABC transporter ATP-binding protein [Natronosalvus rutilus]UTF54970.1 ABC transporter ATP-binding protein [Natronosalvus rutilus]
MTTIALHDVAKRYGDVTALAGIDLEVESGEVFGFLGPNGAGKSTTIDILLRYTYPSSGRVEVLGHDVTSDPVAVRERTGILPEGYAPFETMTGRQHLEYAIAANDADDDPDVLLERVDVAHAADRKAIGYSKGMTQRLGLAMALVGEPELLILDEPSTGLDPHGVRLMRQIVREERDRGATVFFSSHILEQVEAVADRVGILRQGSLIAVDTIDGLRSANEGDGELVVELETADGVRERVAGGETAAGSNPPAGAQVGLEPVVAAVDSLAGVSAVRRDGDALVVACATEAKLDVLDTIREQGATIIDFSTAETSLEELFVSYTEGGR